MRTNISKMFGDALGRVLSKEGTSEGAKRGWETRRGGSPEMPKVGERVRVGSGSYTVESFDTDDTFPPAIASYEVKSGYLFYHGRDGSEGVVSGSKKEAKKWMEDVDREVKERPHETPRPWQESDGGGENMRRAEESAKKAADTFGLAPSKVEFGVTTGFSAVAGEHSGDTVYLINAHKPDLASLSFDTKVTVGEHAAAHEVAHRVFSGDPESGRKAMEEMGQVKKPVSMYHAIAGDFEGLMDAAAAYVHSPEDLKAFSPETFAAVEAWAKRSRDKHSE